MSLTSISLLESDTLSSCLFLSHFWALQEQYEQPRKMANSVMITGLDAIKAAFAVQAPPLAALRSTGLSLIDMLPPVKNNIMKFAMGLH
jgi:2-polyprenyl-6-methoxyphenol hydroxylase-like FAD-dependent oxidoreductase